MRDRCLGGRSYPFLGKEYELLLTITDNSWIQVNSFCYCTLTLSLYVNQIFLVWINLNSGLTNETVS